MTGFKLIEPALELKETFITMAAEYQAHGEKRYAELLPQLERDFTRYVQRLEMDAAGIDLPEGYVPQSTFWSVEDHDLIGVIRIRHKLTPWLKQIGGHIGYDIRPTRRRKGYGTRQLQLALEKLRDWRWTKALITCNDNNIASARIIEANGGKLWDVIHPESEPTPIRRYWIHIV
ncbi:MAG: GNAT family N-acetyltransferase [Anaerolineaceae bacterium]|nr:GNAT family N-acetyltransferase [Anaerolineaceae bacterium]